ncbi:MAG: SPASM domain-containing protein [Clostridia bacterium]|nr:SPASM domain-containing protein [Clostridia bacterium]
MDFKEPMYYLRPDSDPADRPRKIYIEPTSLCNLNCSICFRHGWINEGFGNMDFAVFSTLAEEIGSIESVEEIFFGGMGEPLFHPHICSMIRALPKSKKISLLTNGTLLDETLSRELISSGLNELWISMDGFCKEIYENIQLGSRFDLIIKNLEGFNRARAGTDTRLGITFVVTPENVEQLKLINEFADRFNADILNISHMIPASPVKKEDTLYEREDIPVGKMRRFEGKADTKEEYVCPFVTSGAVFIRWDGRVAPCMQLLHNCHTYLYEEKRKITAFFYGDIHNQSLMDCWCNPDYKEFRERVRIFYFPFCTICWGCEDRKENLTDCVYGEAPTCGACLWATGKMFCP